MKHTKKIISSITIIFISVFTFFNGYNMVKDSYFSYADVVDDDILWEPLNSENELVEAFQYYCKSRDLTIEGSVADAVTTFTTGTFNRCCNTLGIDITALQADIKKSTDSNGGLQFLFNSNGITAYNRIFSQFLQDNELSVGDSVNNQIVDSGTYYTGYDNYTSKLYYFSQRWNSTFNTTNYCTSEGSFYKYPASFYTSGGSNASIEVTQNYAVNLNFDYLSDEGAIGGYTGRCNVYKMYFRGTYQGDVYAQLSSDTKGLILYKIGSNDTQISVAWYETHVNRLGEKIYRLWHLYSFNPNSNNLQNGNVYINTNNTVINNNNYEGDTIINNYGTPSQPSTPTPPPSPDYTPAEDWDIELPDLDIPNWILSGKENKFPFDIPFNVMYALSLLQAEPQAPRLQGTMDFGFTTWQYDLDLSDFDSVAQICRNMEFLAFLTGLMLMTRKLIWG